jgi:hypothetical protein
MSNSPCNAVKYPVFSFSDVEFVEDEEEGCDDYR